MDLSTFDSHCSIAVERCIRLANDFVVQDLSASSVEFRVYPNQSYDENLRPGEEVFPDESLADDEFHGPWSRDRVLEFLWRSGAVPEWIDVAVEHQEGGTTVVGLRSCGRFTSIPEYLYYTRGDCPPFGVKSPILPPGWTEGTRFDLHWRSSR